MKVKTFIKFYFENLQQASPSLINAIVTKNIIIFYYTMFIVIKKKLISWIPFHCWDQMDQLGMWLSGRAFALHVKGPGFDPRHLQFLQLSTISVKMAYT